MFAFVLLSRAPRAHDLDEKGQGRLGQFASKQSATFRPAVPSASVTGGGGSGSGGEVGGGDTQVQPRFDVAHLTGDLKAAGATAWMTFQSELARLSRVCVCVCACLLLCASPYVFSCPAGPPAAASRLFAFRTGGITFHEKQNHPFNLSPRRSTIVPLGCSPTAGCLVTAAETNASNTHTHALKTCVIRLKDGLGRRGARVALR